MSNNGFLLESRRFSTKQNVSIFNSALIAIMLLLITQ